MEFLTPDSTDEDDNAILAVLFHKYVSGEKNKNNNSNNNHHHHSNNNNSLFWKKTYSRSVLCDMD